jgi:saccharopine dehydrogenase-like NADP-dependent oxidoreductase
MKAILIIGAGRSSSALISYLLKNAETHNWSVRVGDMNEAFAKDRVGNSTRGTAFRFDINDQQQREEEIQKADLVVSMLPATMHGQVAEDCVHFGKHLVTASYVSDKMRSLDEAAKQKGIILLNEIGLDPGIDHMSAMQVIDDIRARGGEMNAFYSYCGGLVAPESNDNPWGYKFSWNPRNVILAGQGAPAQFIENGEYKEIPYSELFAGARTIEVNGHGKFDAYANRDSLSYRSVYGLENIPTMLRGTLRAEGFCKAWNVLVQLGWTDDTNKKLGTNLLTYAQFTDALLPAREMQLKAQIAHNLGLAENDPAMDMVEWTGVFSDEQIPLENGTAAQILQELLERKWKLLPGDKDMIVMQHEFVYLLNGNEERITSSLVVEGEDEVHTAMAKTVGLPAAIAVKMILTGQYRNSGVVVPVKKELYEPVLKELSEMGIIFDEQHSL